MPLQLQTADTGPAFLPGRIAVDDGVRRNVSRDDRAGSDHGVVPDGNAAEDGRVRSETCSSADVRGAMILGPIPRKCRSGRQHIREHDRRSAEDVIFKRDAVIHRDVVLNLHIAADADVRTKHDILPDAAIATDDDTTQDVAEMPDVCSFADIDAGVDVRGFVHEDAGGVDRFEQRGLKLRVGGGHGGL